MKKGKNCVYILSFIIIVILFYSFSNKCTSDAPSTDIQKSIAQKIIRFHVIANSDSEIDQSLKMCVKIDVLEYLEPLLRGVNDLATAKEIINSELDNITSVAYSTLQSNNCAYDVKAQLCTKYFPIKIYGDIALPAGDYEAVTINIGSASGKNWWCIMYPSLCFVDNTYAVVPEDSKEQLKSILTPDEYDTITSYKKPRIKYRLKILELIH